MAERNGERLYLQVACMLYDQNVINREFGNLMLISDNYPKYVVTMDDISAGTGYKGIKQVHLLDFLASSI